MKKLFRCSVTQEKDVDFYILVHSHVTDKHLTECVAELVSNTPLDEWLDCRENDTIRLWPELVPLNEALKKQLAVMELVNDDQLEELNGQVLVDTIQEELATIEEDKEVARFNENQLPLELEK